MKNLQKIAVLFITLCTAFVLFSCPSDSGSNEKDKNSINVNTFQNGVVSADPKTAEAGTTVTLTVIPDEGYRLVSGSLVVNGFEGTLTAVEDDENGYKQFTFIMPDAEVSIDCEFEEIPEDIGSTSKTVSLAPVMTGGTVLISAAIAEPGDTVTLTVAAYAGYKYSQDTLKINGSAAGLTATDDDAQGRARFTFTMPDADVVVSCSFTSTSGPLQWYAITIENTPNGSIIAVYEQTQALANSEVYVVIVPNKDYRIKADSFTVNGETVELLPFGKDEGRDVWFFKMPAEDIAVFCIFEMDEPEYFSNDFDTSLCSFYDKFEDTSGANFTAGGVNLDKWGFQNGNGSEYGIAGWGNSERQAYRTENVTVKDGILTINAKYVNPQVNSRSYTSGKLVSANSKGLATLGEPAGGTGTKFGQTYGRFEAKIRMNAGIGAWPAFWMMPVASAYGGWPRSGEIDIMEMTGDRTTHSSATLHVMPNGGGQGSGSTYHGVNRTFMNSKTFSDWHVYGLIWTPTQMIFLLDGYVCRTLLNTWWQTGWYATNGYPGSTNSYPPFDRDFHFIINLALDSGAFRSQNAIDNNRTDLNYTLEVDWVRAYTLEDDPWETPDYPSNLKSDY